MKNHCKIEVSISEMDDFLMKRLFRITFISCLIFLPQVVFSGDISEHEKKAILAMADDFFESGKYGEIPNVLKHLDKNFKSHIYRNGSVKTYSLGDYKNSLIQILPLYSDYEYRRTEEEFSFQKNHVFTFRLKENFKLNGKEYIEEHNEKWILVREGNDFKIKEVSITY